jgi:hypothetical protein
MTTIQQLTVFLENKSGRLTDVLATLRKENINITALTIADTSEYGLLRLIVSDPEKTFKLLKNAGFSVTLTDVYALGVPHTPGSLSQMLEKFSDAELSIEYMYAFSFGKQAMIVLRTDNRHKAGEIIEKNGFKVFGPEDVKSI